MISLPRGFRCHVTNIGVKDTSYDFVVISADRDVPAAGVFTKSRFAGPSVAISREHLASGPSARAVVVVSKNANVANGDVGLSDARELVGGVAARLGCSSREILLASTGVIGRRYPMDRIRAGIAALPSQPESLSADDAATGIMTTDTFAKSVEATIGLGAAKVVGIAKGVGMIEPDMATMIAIILTDADIGSDRLDVTFREVVDRTFNCVSIDTDTSTSDTAVMLASGSAGKVDEAEFLIALDEVCLGLTKMIARDGEGAKVLIEVSVDGARDNEQAKRVAKSIVNSPLVKTAVHGADPNWGRVAMAIGKCTDDTDIDQRSVVIRFGESVVYPGALDDAGLAALSAYMRSDHVLIHVTLATGASQATVWGCDLTDGYIRINADYTT